MISGRGLIILCFAVVVLAALPSGCKKSAQSGRNTRVELSEVRLTIVDSSKFRLALKYRFVQGKPEEGRGASCDAEIRYGKGNGFLATLFAGLQERLQQEGSLEGEYPFIKPLQPGDVVSYEIKMTQGEPDSSVYNQVISDVVKGSVRWDGN
jgi:hypothetical protein